LLDRPAELALDDGGGVDDRHGAASVGDRRSRVDDDG
jgi:hypothetical protein